MKLTLEKINELIELRKKTCGGPMLRLWNTSTDGETVDSGRWHVLNAVSSADSSEKKDNAKYVAEIYNAIPELLEMAKAFATISANKERVRFDFDSSEWDWKKLDSDHDIVNESDDYFDTLPEALVSYARRYPNDVISKIKGLVETAEYEEDDTIYIDVNDVKKLLEKVS